MSEEIYPADFLISVDGKHQDGGMFSDAKDKEICMKENCWVYCFAENKVFRAEKKNNNIYAYENGSIIGTFEYRIKKTLFIKYDENYTVNWRGCDFSIEKILQGFVYP